MKCGGCVRAVEQPAAADPGGAPGQRQSAHPYGLGRPGAGGRRSRGHGCGSAACPPERPRGPGLSGPAAVPGSGAVQRAGARQTDHWWRQWRHLVVALLLLLVSGLGHLADAGQLPWRGPWNALGTPWFHALVASLALAVPGRPILSRGVAFRPGRGPQHGQPGGAGGGQCLSLQPGGLALAGQRLALLLQRACDAAGLRPHRPFPGGTGPLQDRAGHRGTHRPAARPRPAAAGRRSPAPGAGGGAAARGPAAAPARRPGPGGWGGAGGGLQR